jgi:hypothetical protein
MWAMRHAARCRKREHPGAGALLRPNEKVGCFLRQCDAALGASRARTRRRDEARCDSGGLAQRVAEIRRVQPDAPPAQALDLAEKRLEARRGLGRRQPRASARNGQVGVRRFRQARHAAELQIDGGHGVVDGSSILPCERRGQALAEFARCRRLRRRRNGQGRRRCKHAQHCRLSEALT